MPFEFSTKLAPEVEPAALGRSREKRKIKDVPIDIPYGEEVFQFVLRTEPSILDIYQAVATGDIDDRPYDDEYKPVLYAEFEAESGLNRQTGENLGRYIDVISKYHARRVAYFVLTKWTNPIIGLNEDGLRDGGHRFRAAMFMGWDEVWVDYPAPEPAEAPTQS